jgi:polyhydroxyalkanoate synthesis regulator phasin
MADTRRSGSQRGSGSSGSASSRGSSRTQAPAGAASRGGQVRSRQQRARSRARRASADPSTPAEAGDISAKTVAEFREALRTNLVGPLDLIMLSRERIEEAFAEAVERGRVTAADAEELAASLIERGRKQTNDVLSDLEHLVGRGRGEVEARTADARRRSTDAARSARRRVEAAAGGARRAADPVLAQADRARRTTGVGRTFPVRGYEDLTAAQVQSRLSALTAAELRKVRDYERRHANRKTVLRAIEDRLG